MVILRTVHWKVLSQTQMILAGIRCKNFDFEDTKGLFIATITIKILLYI